MSNYLWPDPEHAAELLNARPSSSERLNVSRYSGHWVATMRHLLGMSLDEMAALMNVHRSSVIRLEQSEAEGRATLRRMEEAAGVLGVEFVYALIPSEEFVESVQRRHDEMELQQHRHKRLKVIPASNQMAKGRGKDRCR